MSRIPLPVYQAIKRAFDVAASAQALICLQPLFAGIALAIKLDSKGPVFYRADRVGRDGRMFRIFKFRTMVPDAEKRGATSCG
jgi:lipopolysaccharide/colanic/teichoic acid biosynthesis glycosyltransferase